MNKVAGIENASIEPLYNIGVVSRMTGLTMATLRAWERRYKFPSAERTMGGHRLYSEKDVLGLQWVKSRIDDGMQTSQAIHAFQLQKTEGNLRLLENQDTYLYPSSQVTKDGLEGVTHKLINSLENLDVITADRLISDLLVSHPPEEIILEVIAPTLSAFGDEWEKGNISVSTEHLATNILRQKLVMWMISAPPPRQISPVVLACAPDEWHEGSLLLLGSILRRRRIPVVYLGQAVPLSDLVKIVDEVKPSIIVFVAMMEDSARLLLNWPEYFESTDFKRLPAVGYGGRAYIKNKNLISQMDGIYLGDTITEGLQIIESYVRD